MGTFSEVKDRFFEGVLSPVCFLEEMEARIDDIL